MSAARPRLLLLFSSPVKLDQVAQASLVFARVFSGRFVVETAKKVAFFFGKSMKLNLAGLTMKLFEFVHMLFVHMGSKARGVARVILLRKQPRATLKRNRACFYGLSVAECHQWNARDGRSAASGREELRHLQDWEEACQSS